MQEEKSWANLRSHNKLYKLEAQWGDISYISYKNKSIPIMNNIMTEYGMAKLYSKDRSNSYASDINFLIKDPKVAYCALFPVFSDELCTVDKLSSILGINKFRLHHIFTESTGISLKAYMRVVKIQMAAMNILCTEDKMIDISFSTGYDSQEAFIRAFKRHFHLTPGGYKKMLSKESSFQTSYSSITHRIWLSAKVVHDDVFKRDELGTFIKYQTLKYRTEAGNIGSTILSQAPRGSLQVVLSD